ncbi:MAG: sulfatase-like hydrolase/transferase [Candidatus Sumerlaeia bacterium]|nr:sulfatase-like hydrolase/transferase [Candidatus Sumerlaeia bacterium]
MNDGLAPSMRLPKPPRAVLTRRQFLHTSAAAATLAATGAAPWAAPVAERPNRKPNILVIVADDLGYRELGVQGCPDIPTPHIDSIAKNGVRFTDGYVSCPICAPTRAGLLTGRYQQRYGFETNPGPEQYAAENFGLPRSETTLAERLKAFGYATGMVGKWHVGFKPELTPPQRGFDEFFGFLGGANNYIPSRARNTIFRGNETVNEEEYLTDAFGREAVAFIEKNKDKPFFLYLPFNAVHSPLEAIEKYLARFPNISDPKRRTYAAMTAAMDDAVGRVLETLRRLNLEDNTLIFFVSDNGGPTLQTTSSNLPLRGYKAQVLEGGIRVPFLVQWKSRLPAGKVYAHPVIQLDIFPTAVAAAGETISPEWKLDGVNLLPYLTGEKQEGPHETLYWRFNQQRALRQGDWKLIVQTAGAKPSLYNLADDIGEANDLAGKMPDKVKELESVWQAWNAQLMAPQWIRQDAGTQGTPKKAGVKGKAGGSLQNRFKELDRNGDGRLTADELPRPALFKQMDANGDGVVTLDEAKSAFAGARQPKAK